LFFLNANAGGQLRRDLVFLSSRLVIALNIPQVAKMETGTRQQGNKATRQQGNKATRQQGNKQTLGKTLTWPHFSGKNDYFLRGIRSEKSAKSSGNFCHGPKHSCFQIILY
jgi:hypothetical protein